MYTRTSPSPTRPTCLRHRPSLPARVRTSA